MNLNRHDSQVWVFGMVESQNRNNRKVFVFPDRRSETLFAIIRRHVSPGSVIHHDGALFYSAMDFDSIGVTGRRHVH